MAIRRNDINMYFSFKNLVNHTMFLCNLTRSLPRTIAFQWFRMSSARCGMYSKFFYKTLSFTESLWFRLLQSQQVLFRLRGENYAIH